MWINSQNQLYVGDCVPGDREATQAEVADYWRPRMWEVIKTERERRKAGGVKVKVGTVDKWLHSDYASRIQQMDLVMMGASIPANLQWKTLDGSFVTVTQAIFGVAEAHRVALQASADPAAYDYSTGWPVIFGE